MKKKKTAPKKKAAAKRPAVQTRSARKPAKALATIVDASKSLSASPASAVSAGKLDTRSEDAAPLVGVRGRVTPKPAAPARSRAKSGSGSGSPVGIAKYIDRGESAEKRYEGTRWDGAIVRTSHGAQGLEESLDGGKTWSVVFTPEQYIAHNPRNLAYTLLTAKRENTTTMRPRPVDGTPKEKLFGGKRAEPRSAETIAAEDAALPVISSASQSEGWTTEKVPTADRMESVYISPDGVKYVRASDREKACLLYKNGVTVRLRKYEGSALAALQRKYIEEAREETERVAAKAAKAAT